MPNTNIVLNVDGNVGNDTTTSTAVHCAVCNYPADECSIKCDTVLYMACPLMKKLWKSEVSSPGCPEHHEQFVQFSGLGFVTLDPFH